MPYLHDTRLFPYDKRSGGHPLADSGTRIGRWRVLPNIVIGISK